MADARTRSRRKSLAIPAAAEPDELTALTARVAELEAAEAERARAMKVQDALYRIADTASAVHDMAEFYPAIHRIVGELMFAENFYIALYDEERQMLNYPYMVDQVDEAIDPAVWHRIGTGWARGATAYVLRTGSPALITKERYEELIALGEIDRQGADGEDWLGVPLRSESRTVGVLVVQSYETVHRYSRVDVDLLAFVGQHVATALSRVRAVEETRERNAELAIINEIGTALAGELDMAAMYELVGDRVRDLFHADTMFIATYDRETNVVSFPYEIDKGERVSSEPFEFGPGLTSMVIRTGRPLRFDTQPEMLEVGAIVAGALSSSWLGVPMIGADGVTGVIALESYEPHAFSETDERLLRTLASNLGVALEGARLLDQTRQRNAELAVINSIQAGLAAELDMQSMYDLVGDKIAEIFDTHVVDIATYDREADLLYFPYAIERGVRLYDEPRPAFGFRRRVLETGQPLLIEDLQLAGGRVREPSDSDVRGAGEVARLRPARLGRPGGRGDLAPEPGSRARLQPGRHGPPGHPDGQSERGPRERPAHRRDPAAGLRAGDHQRDRDGARRRARDDRDVRAGRRARPGPVQDRRHVHRGVRSRDQPHRLPVRDRERRAVPLRADRARSGRDLDRDPDGETRALRLDRRGHRTWSDQLRGRDELLARCPDGRRSGGVRRHRPREPQDERLQRGRRAPPRHTRLEPGRWPSRAPGLFDETRRLLAETDQRAAELAILNGVQRGLAEQLDMQRMYDLVGDKVQEIFDAQGVDIGIIDPSDGLVHFPYTIERGVRFPDEPMELIGFRRHVIETGEPLLVAGDVSERAVEFGQPPVHQGEPARSALFVPLLVGGAATGVILIENLDRDDAFDDGDVRFLTTLAASLSVALENARLIDETRRLLAETDQRAAELAIVNEIGTALSGELEMAAMYELVGDRLRELFQATDLIIAHYDRASNLISFPYELEGGARLHSGEEIELGQGITSIVVQTGRPLRIGTSAEADALGAIWSGSRTESWLGVPMVGSEGVFGVISLFSFEVNAYTGADERLLVTLASNLAVALQSARLFDETRRLLAETDQRAAELAIVNSVGQALASHLDLDTLIAQLGDQMVDTFAADVAYVALHDPETDLIDFAYYSEDGEHPPQAPLKFGEGLTSRILTSHEPLLLNQDAQFEAIGTRGVGVRASSYLGVPIMVGDHAIGVISVQSTSEVGRFGESDTRLLATLAANVGVAIQNARLYRDSLRRANEMAALAEVGSEISAMLDVGSVLERIGERARTLLAADTSAVYLADADGQMFRPIVALGGDRGARSGRTRSSSARGSSATLPDAARPG